MSIVEHKHVTRNAFYPGFSPSIRYFFNLPSDFFLIVTFVPPHMSMYSFFPPGYTAGTLNRDLTVIQMHAQQIK